MSDLERISPLAPSSVVPPRHLAPWGERTFASNPKIPLLAWPAARPLDFRPAPEMITHPPLKIDLQKIDPPKNRSGRQPKNCNFHILAPFQPFDLKTRLPGFLDPRIFSRRVPGPRISLKRPTMPKINFYLPPGLWIFVKHIPFPLKI